MQPRERGDRSPAERAALERAISPDRLGTYQAAAAVTGCDVLDLYVWDRDLASAILADIAIVEVALRNALHTALSKHYGADDWYTLDIGLDERSQRALTTAWTQLKKPLRTPGRVISRLMFGFWVGLLDAGGYSGAEPQAFRRDYEQLFRTVLHRAFPGGRPEAKAASVAFTREWVHGRAVVVQNLRNRAAHHEPLVAGFPLNGQRDTHGAAVRMTAPEGHTACIQIARLLDRDLASWLARNTAVPDLLSHHP